MMKFRIACSRFGQDGHQLHGWEKFDRKAAEQAVTDANHNAEVRPDGFYNRVCAPYVLETREVTMWTEAVDDDDAHREA